MKHRSEQRNVILLTLIVAGVAIGVGTITLSSLYRTAMSQQRARLTEIAMSRSSVIEAAAWQWARQFPGEPERVKNATLEQLRWAHAKFEGFGETGEFTLAQREEEQIVFLLSHRHGDVDDPPPVAFSGRNAEPMRRALSGESGTVTGLDYRGERVLAAYEPVRGLDMGVVAKIDLAEVRAPFVRTGAMASAIGLLLILLGGFTAGRIGKRLNRRLEETARQLRRAQRIAGIGYVDWNMVSGKFIWSAETYRLFGYAPGEIEPDYDLMSRMVHPEDVDLVRQRIAAVLKTGGRYDLDYRIVTAGGKVRHVHAQGKLVRGSDGRPLRIVGTLLDITTRKQALEALRTSEANNRALIRSIPDLIVKIGRDGIHRECRPAVGFESTPEDIVGRSFRELLPPAPARLAADALEHTFATGEMQTFEYAIPCGEQQRHFEARFVLAGEDEVMGIVREVTSRWQAEDELRKLSMVVEQSPACVLITSPSGEIEYINPKFLELTGYTEDEVIGRNVRFLKSGHMSDAEYESLWATVTSGHTWKGRIQEQKKNGDFFWIDTTVSPVTDPNGNIVHFVQASEDVTARMEAEERLVHQARHDYLTGMPNRLMAKDRLAKALAGARRHGHQVALLFLDLDIFKRVNDTLGHASGDEILKQAAARLCACVRDTDTVARFGGDEFLVIVPDVTDSLDVETIAEKLLQAFVAPFKVNDREIVVTASVGVAIYPEHGTDQDTLLQYADSALYEAKEKGRNKLCFYTSALGSKNDRRLQLETHLRRALERNEISLRYQPVMDVKSGQLIGAEALVRWENRELGPVPTHELISVAEETGLIIPIGEWILSAACREACGWRGESGLPLRLAVNVSSRQFQGSGLVRAVSRSLLQCGLEPQRLELEITEGLLLDDSPATTEILEVLSEKGVRLAVDDFGTGYSALSYLKRLPIDTLKIDQAFMTQVVSADHEDAALVTAIIQLAHGLGLSVVAEGVETNQQLRFLRSQSCDLAQGYYFSQPLSAEEFQAYLGLTERALKIV